MKVYSTRLNSFYLIYSFYVQRLVKPVHSKSATVFEGDQKAPFLIYTTLRWRGGLYFPWIAPLYPWYVPYIAVSNKQVSSTILESFVWHYLGLNPGLLDLWRTLYSLKQCPHLEVSAKYIPTKQRTKSRVPWETLAVREKRADEKTASKCNRKNPTNSNALKLKKARSEFAKIYLKELKKSDR